MSETSVLESSGRIATSRRHLIKGIVAVAALALSDVRPVAATDGWAVHATTYWDGFADLWSGADATGESFAALDPGTTVRLLEGPTPDGWYHVDPIHLADVPPGWIPGWLLLFGQRARAFVDHVLLGGPGDWADEVGPLRHGFSVTLIGPVVGDWVLVRSSERVGYASIWTLEPTDAPETDRTAEYWVDVNRSTGEARLFVGDSMVELFRASVSADSGEGFYATAVGTYWIYENVEGLTYTPYADAYFMYWAGFDSDRYNEFHSWTVDADGSLLEGGWGTTAGCVSTAPDDALSIYHFVDFGTRVEVPW